MLNEVLRLCETHWIPSAVQQNGPSPLHHANPVLRWLMLGTHGATPEERLASSGLSSEQVEPRPDRAARTRVRRSAPVDSRQQPGVRKSSEAVILGRSGLLIVSVS